MPGTEESDKKRNANREFMREKIVRQPMSKRQIATRLAVFACLAVLFGVISAVSFVLAKPLADRYLGKEDIEESTEIQFTKDEPETAAPLETSPSEGLLLEEDEEMVSALIEEALTDYSFTRDNLNSFYGALRDIGVQAGKGIVTVSSGRQQTDLFGNPVESTGDFAGAVIARTSGEYLIFTDADAVRQADSIAVVFQDGTRADGTVKQIDGVLNMAVISVPSAALNEDTDVQVLPLGNSYSVRAGDMLVGVGGPSGMIHSITHGAVSFVARNVQMTDGITRILYADISSNPNTGTFLFNMSGEIVGWSAEEYQNEDNSGLSSVVSISDYKAILENMTNGKQSPYFGVRGQEVSEAMTSEGIPQGVYVLEAVADSPAYDAGIQNGDIICQFGEKEITTFKELQIQIESCQCGVSVPVKVMRKGRDGYIELEYNVNIRAR